MLHGTQQAFHTRELLLSLLDETNLSVWRYSGFDSSILRTRWRSEKKELETRVKGWWCRKESERSRNVQPRTFYQIRKLKPKLAKCLALNIT